MAFSIEKYLEEHNLSSTDKIIKHIEELKRNTIPNIWVISNLIVFVVIQERVKLLEKYKKDSPDYPEARKGLVPSITFAKLFEDLKNSTENSEDNNIGIKDSQNEEKAPIFTYCKVNKHALEALAMRALYGHKKYEKGDDWENFSRVPNGDFEYSNSMFRHALGIGEDTEEEHLISTAWNAVARLEIFFRNKEQNK